MAKFSISKLISVAVKATEKALKTAVKDREKQVKAATALRVKSEKERSKLEQKLASNFTKTYKTVSPTNVYGKISRPKTKQGADNLNKSFRESDHKRTQQLDFVVGMEIHRSNNPDQSCEICRIGAGKYPKDFKWTGWHDGCKCYSTSILCTHEEMGEYFRTGVMKSKKTITVIPESTLSWIKNHNKELKNFKWVKANGLAP